MTTRPASNTSTFFLDEAPLPPEGRKSFPQRPTLPPLFYCAASFWAATAAILSLFQHASPELILSLSLCGIVASASLGLALYLKGLRPFLLVLLGICMGLACAGQAAYSLRADTIQLAQAGVDDYRFQIIEDVSESDFGAYCLARAYNPEGKSYLVRVNLPKEVQAACWDVFELRCAIRKPSRTAASYYWRKGCVGSITPYRVDVHAPAGILGLITSARRAGIEQYSQHNSEGELFLRSIVFGDRSDLFSSPLYGSVKRVGLAHIVAVSGAHLGISIAFIAALLRALKVPRGVSLGIQAAVCVSYVLFTGAPHSAMRACLMALCLLFAFFGNRRSFALNALSVCVIVFIALQPRLCLSVSLLLSSLATCGIILFSPYFTAWLLHASGGRFKALCDILGMTLSAIVATLPVTLPLFSQFSLIAPLSNLLTAPLFSLLCVGGMIAAFLGALVPGLGIAVGLMVLLAQGFSDLVHLLAAVPFAAIAVNVPTWLSAGLSFLGACLVLKRWPRPTRTRALSCLAALLAFLVSVLVLFPHAHATEIIMLNVGQGDAFVLRSGTQAVLIDTGNQEGAVLKGLARHDIRHLDAIMVSHPDDDHCGALATVCDFVEVDRVLVAQDLLACTCANCSKLRKDAPSGLLVGLAVGDVLNWGPFSARVIHPIRFAEEGGNADSLVVHVEVDANCDGISEACALFCGDAESEVLAQLQEQGLLEQVDIYKVGHHGSGGAFTPDQLGILAPSLALVSVGENNRYGHPNEEVIDMLEQAGAAVLRTDQSGDVICKLDATRISVQTVK